MKIINIFDLNKNFKGTNGAIGNFDGVHLGHQLIFKKLKGISKNLPSIVLTFEPHPEKVLRSKKKINLIHTKKQKYELISKYGVDFLIEIPFDLNFSKIPAKEFVLEFLVKKLNIRKLVIGKNFVFGYKKSGNFKTLKGLSKKYGFNLEVVKPLNFEGVLVSSTNIRNLLKKGKIEEANKLLGRNYSMFGKVVKGKGLGKKYFVPTINVKYENDLLLKEGIYSGYTKIGEKEYLSAISLGKNPTFKEKETVLEAHLLNFHGNLYGKKAEVFFCKKVRNQKKFKSQEELREQILKDIEFIKKPK